jgi:hypothetical protein
MVVIRRQQFAGEHSALPKQIKVSAIGFLTYSAGQVNLAQVIGAIVVVGVVLPIMQQNSGVQ